MSRVAVVCDDPSSFNIAKDTTYLMLKTAQDMGHECFVIEPADLFVDQTEARAWTRRLTVLSDQMDWFEATEKSIERLGDFDLILIRQDPPFNMRYIYATYILELAEAQGAKVVNKPGSLRNANEKFFITQFPDAITRTLVTANKITIKNFLETEQDIILKPLDGMGGASICRLKTGDPNISVIIEMLTQQGIEPIMVQRYLPDVIKGDKRILIVNGVAISHCLARLPQPGETRANLAAGGRSEVRVLTERDQELAAMIGPRLKDMGLLFVGLDVIGDYVTEINVTSPTCAQEILKVSGVNACEILFKEIIPQ